ncbi:hypothetical protein EYZ11_009200 [Aspergillus tanneri]|uniref:Uncharacterized protein n=1 Tax=Aspergillus tanneri TaxID=1220188 RepID=A0A4S3J8W8_9EURO|nr:hypothetical protein EYZ11_009200 [Aspergillus tanneri]
MPTTFNQPMTSGEPSRMPNNLKTDQYANE